MLLYLHPGTMHCFLAGMQKSSFLSIVREEKSHITLTILMFLAGVVIEGVGVQGGKVAPDTLPTLFEVLAVDVVQDVGSRLVAVVTHGAVVVSLLGLWVVADLVKFGQVAARLTGGAHLKPVFSGPVIPLAGP